jgi:hypothetical protein
MAKNEQQPFHDRDHPWQPCERVRPDEEFLLFDTNRKHTRTRFSDDGFFAGLTSSIRLETGLFGALALSGIAAPYIKERSAVLTPFDRNQGYPLDQEDLFAARRAAKARSMKHERDETIQGLLLFVFGGSAEQTDRTLVQALVPADHQIQEHEQAAHQHRLFLTLKFPGGASFTAQAHFYPQRPLLLFRTFFPSDTGPLPRIDHMLSPAAEASVERATRSGIFQEPGQERSEGFDLLLPFDLAKIQTIRAKFLFLATAQG